LKKIRITFNPASLGARGVVYCGDDYTCMSGTVSLSGAAVYALIQRFSKINLVNSIESIAKY